MSIVEIRVQGQLDQTWSLWLEGLTITPLDENQTLLSGRLPDQAALFGLISRLRDTGQELVSLRYRNLKYIDPND
jgi:hypothetical protein